MGARDVKHLSKFLRTSEPMIACLVALLGCTVALAQSDTVWVRHLGGTGNGDDEVSALATGGDGSVYAAILNRPNDSAAAVMTARYSAEGALLWCTRFAGEGYVVPIDIGVDGAGNAYVTGSSRRQSGWYDFVTLKYTSAGESAWARYYDAEGDNDEPSGLAVDDAGITYVVGYGETDSRYEDFALVKYSPDGQELWSRLYDHQNYEDFGLDVALDSQGYVYSVGTVCNWESGGDFDMQVLKYSAGGNLEWARTFRGPGENEDSAVAVAIDPQGNVLVAGCTHPSRDSSGYLLVKFSSAGDTIWTRSLVDDGDYNNAVAVGTDGQGNVIIAGNLLQDFFAAKYSPSGAKQWEERYVTPTPDSLAAMVVAASGHIYLTGRFKHRRDQYHDMTTVEYTPGGQQGWVRSWVARDRLGSAGLAVVQSGSSVVVAGSYDHWGRDVNGLVVGYDSQGEMQWERRQSGLGRHSDAAVDVTFDADGNVILAGYLDMTNQARDVAAVKYSPDGELVWLRTYGGIQGGEDAAVALTVDEEDNVLVTGYSEGDSTGLDYVTLKYSPSGDLLWTRTYNGPSNGDDIPVAIAAGPDGSVVVTGRSFLAGSDDDILTVCYSTSGTELWTGRINGSADSADYPGSVLVDSTGATYVVGAVRQELVPYSRSLAVVCKYGHGGTQEWLSICEDPDSLRRTFYAQDVVVRNGAIYVGGSGTVHLAAKLDASGGVEWRSRASRDEGAWVNAAALVGDSRLVLTGGVERGVMPDYATSCFDLDGTLCWQKDAVGSLDHYDEASDIAGGPNSVAFVTGLLRTSSGIGDMGTIAYDTLGNVVWADSFDTGSSYDRGIAVCCDPSGRVVVAGCGAGDSYSHNDFLTVAYEPRIGILEPLGPSRPQGPAQLAVHPNPFSCRVLFATQGRASGAVRLRIYDSGGRLVRSFLGGERPGADGNHLVWDGRDDTGRELPSGVYTAVAEKLRDAGSPCNTTEDLRVKLVKMN